MTDRDPFDVGAIAERLREAGQAVIAGGQFTDESGVAWLLDCSPRTLRDWRMKGEGPPCYLGARWLYGLPDLFAWLASRTPQKIDRRIASNSGGSDVAE